MIAKCGGKYKKHKSLPRKLKNLKINKDLLCKKLLQSENGGKNCGSEKFKEDIISKRKNKAFFFFFFYAFI